MIVISSKVSVWLEIKLQNCLCGDYSMNDILEERRRTEDLLLLVYCLRWCRLGLLERTVVTLCLCVISKNDNMTLFVAWYLICKTISKAII
jgi:hypothetical protein